MSLSARSSFFCSSREQKVRGSKGGAEQGEALVVASRRRAGGGGKGLAVMYSLFDGFSWEPVVQAFLEAFKAGLCGFGSADGTVVEFLGRHVHRDCCWTPRLLWIFSSPNKTMRSFV